MVLRTFLSVFMSVCKYVPVVLVCICLWALMYVFFCLHAFSVLLGKPVLFHMKHHAVIARVFTARGFTCITNVSAARAAINQKTR